MKGVTKTESRRSNNMGRNSKDNSLTRYEEMLRISVRYNEYISKPSFRIMFASITRKPKTEAERYVFHVRNTLKELDKEDKDILVNEFFSFNNNSFWWTKRYTKSTYYRKRYLAIKSFFERYAQ